MAQPADKRTIRKARVRESIKTAALDLARRQGWAGVTIRKIADAIDYTAPIVYEHFKSKDDLYHHLVHDGFEQLSRQTLERVAIADHPEEKLVAMAEVRFNFALDNPMLHHLMFDTDNPQWQRVEMERSMLGIKQLIDGLIMEISQDSDRAMEYIFNLICLIKGYTYFANHLMSSSTKMAKFFPADRKILTNQFLDAVRRFILSIQKT